LKFYWENCLGGKSATSIGAFFLQVKILIKKTKKYCRLSGVFWFLSKKNKVYYLSALHSPVFFILVFYQQQNKK